MKVSKGLRSKKKIFMILFVYAVVITSYFCLHTFSKYVSSTTGTPGTKDIAKWDIELDTTSSNSTLNLVSGNTTNQQTYSLTITSTSEVAAECSLVVTNIPTGVQMSVDNNTTYLENNNRIEVDDLCSFEADDSNDTKSFLLTFIAPLSVDAVSNRQVGISVVCLQSSF